MSIESTNVSQKNWYLNRGGFGGDAGWGGRGGEGGGARSPFFLKPLVFLRSVWRTTYCVYWC